MWQAQRRSISAQKNDIKPRTSPWENLASLVIVDSNSALGEIPYVWEADECNENGKLPRYSKHKNDSVERAKNVKLWNRNKVKQTHPIRHKDF